MLAAGTAVAATAQEVVRLPQPPFPPPLATADGPGPARLVLVAARYHSPADLGPDRPDPPAAAPRRFRGAGLDFAVRQGRRVFLVYGGRYLVKRGRDGYALDFERFLRPPNRASVEELTWAREEDGVLYVEHTNLEYASVTRRRNAYVTAVDPAEGRIRWRSRALVGNARTFVLAGDFIVSGHGFTAESDFLYLLDRRSGRALDRLPLPSAPERIRLRGDRLLVRCYDAVVVARIVR